ncbi:RND family efflux transporter MFP subunit [Hydrogenophaga palleronii]|uniref:RND family efflux transporter MFP subunit n=1 Tax=Hydrogenophaga palleronii TaxID=65655 RepID=A0ABU1WUY7_9BURK|nr:HlyD family efflux transporter periplasmic adaptor subunit [Hydrogenophaga palleronii]MDR7152672.1 RND family efflux transporter MFP subunit [Hydrogenophaga palleronii]
MSRHALCATALFAGLLLALPATAKSGTASTQAPAPTPAPVAQLAPVRVVLAPSVETTLLSQMPGRLTVLNATLGSNVVKGREVVRFDCEEQLARLKMGDAELAGAEQSMEVKLRLQGMKQATDTEVALAASQVDRARAQSGVYKAQLDHCSVAAPFSGRVVKLHVRPFQGVVAGQPLMDLVGDGPLKIRMNVPSLWLKWLKKGAPFDVAIEETGKRYQARVHAINARVDPVSQTIEIEGQLATRPAELLAGMSGNAFFDAPEQ